MPYTLQKTSMITDCNIVIKNNNIVKYYCNLKYLFSIVIYLIYLLCIPVMAKQPLLQSSVLRDPSEIILIYWFGAQETFIIIIINGENSNVFMEIMMRFFFFKFKRTAIIWNIHFRNIINVFTVTFAPRHRDGSVYLNSYNFSYSKPHKLNDKWLLQYLI